MGIVFKAPHPLFGRADKPLPSGYQQRSPYYWWWEFLRRNEDYKECCAAGGEGALAGLYKDFGDVVSNHNFKAWWTERGFRLFAERPKPVKLAELSSPSEWDSSWTQDSVMVVAVPLDLPKRYLQGFFAKLLKERHGGKRGRKALSDSHASTARYPLHRNVSIHTLRIQLAVFDAVTAKKRGEHKKKLAQIGAELKLVPSAMPSSKDDRVTAEHKRNVMAATVSRHYKDASRIVANTAMGQFPNSQ